jgi:hypothetical protein
LANLYGWLAYLAGPIIWLLIIVTLALACVVGWLAVRLRRLERHYHALTAGADGNSLEAVLESHIGQVRTALGRVGELDERVQRLEEGSQDHIQHVGFLRFNPFRDTGGDQSFVIALADARGDGVVISSLHSRDVTRVYAKALGAWESFHPLTDEEQQAISHARGEAHRK